MMDFLWLSVLREWISWLWLCSLLNETNSSFSSSFMIMIIIFYFFIPFPLDFIIQLYCCAFSFSLICLPLYIVIWLLIDILVPYVSVKLVMFVLCKHFCYVSEILIINWDSHWNGLLKSRYMCMNNTNKSLLNVYFYYFYFPDIGRLAQNVKVRQRFVLCFCCFIRFPISYVHSFIYKFFWVHWFLLL